MPQHVLSSRKGNMQNKDPRPSTKEGQSFLLLCVLPGTAHWSRHPCNFHDALCPLVVTTIEMHHDATERGNRKEGWADIHN